MKKILLVVACLFGLCIAPKCISQNSNAVMYAQNDLGQKLGNYTAQLCETQYQMGDTYTVEVYKTYGGAITVMFRGQKCAAWYERECKECSGRAGYFFSCNGNTYMILAFKG